MLRKLFFNARMSFRTWVRNRTRPLTIVEAEEKKLFWSKMYMMCGFLMFLTVTTMLNKEFASTNVSESIPIYKGLVEKAEPDAKFRIVRISGFKKVSDVVMSPEEILKASDTNKSETNSLEEQ